MLSNAENEIFHILSTYIRILEMKAKISIFQLRLLKSLKRCIGKNFKVFLVYCCLSECGASKSFVISV